jgi:hypothetical protein
MLPVQTLLDHSLVHATQATLVVGPSAQVCLREKCCKLWHRLSYFVPNHKTQTIRDKARQAPLFPEIEIFPVCMYNPDLRIYSDIFRNMVFRRNSGPNMPQQEVALFTEVWVAYNSCKVINAPLCYMLGFSREKSTIFQHGRYDL